MQRYVAYRVIVIAILCAFSWGAYSLYSTEIPSEVEHPVDLSVTPESQPAEVPNAGLIVDESELDFGEVWETNFFPWTVTLRNSTSEDVEIGDFRNFCSCTIRPQSLTVPAGGSADVEFRFNLTPRNPSIRDQLRTHKWPLIPTNIDGHPGTHPGWQVTGTSRRALRLRSYYEEYSLTRSDVREARPMSFLVWPLVPLSSLTATTDMDVGTIQIDEFVDDHSTQYRVSIIPSVSKLTDDFRTRLTLRATTAAKDVSEVDMWVNGYLVN
ncbi:MAG: hypothetical protein KDA93_11290 [Planctomycetaceae bacterium]|nr:hypothetical protein [Planctomycetaceae bacterium]